MNGGGMLIPPNDDGRLGNDSRKREALRAALIEGEQSGIAMPFAVEQFLSEMRGEIDGGMAPSD
jgi:Bacterial antitoxin of ParD toxin-antitoxin type II system and RHH